MVYQAFFKTFIKKLKAKIFQKFKHVFFFKYYKSKNNNKGGSRLQ